MPYSLHSNFREMEALVRAVAPAILRRLVLDMYKNTRLRRAQKLENVRFYRQYVLNILRPGQSGFSQLKQQHTDLTKLSAEFKFWMQEDSQAALLRLLRIDMPPDPTLRRRRLQDLPPELPYVPTGKESLAEIAERLKSTNNNREITDYLGKKPEKKRAKPPSADDEFCTSVRLRYIDDPHLRLLMQKFIANQGEETVKKCAVDKLSE